MWQVVTSARSAARDESGYMLPELLVAIIIFGVVMAGVLGVLIFAQSQAPKNIQYAKAIADATTGLQRITRELRNAYRIGSTDENASGQGNLIDFNAVIGGADIHIRYDCTQPSPTKPSTYNACVRVSASTSGSLPSMSTGAAIVDRIPKTGYVFTFYGPSGAAGSDYPTYVQANVSVPAAGPLTQGQNHLINLNAGTAILNLANGS